MTEVHCDELQYGVTKLLGFRKYNTGYVEFHIHRTRGRLIKKHYILK